MRHPATSETPSPALHLALFMLSAAALAYEITLTRLFSVSQFYHFAFMIVSLALLGYGASGALLAIFPQMGRRHLRRTLGWLCLAAALGILVATLLTNLLPFDSFSVAWDWRQIAVLLLHYLCLAIPFFFTGLVTGMLFTAYSLSIGRTYATNLLGSALGCVFALFIPAWAGAEGSVALSAALAALAALVVFLPGVERAAPRRLLAASAAFTLLAIALLDVFGRAAGRPILPVLNLRISPYKSLSYALQYPGAELVSQHWNAFSRVDVVTSLGIRSFPGLSYRFTQSPPAEQGVYVDADDLSPLVQPGYDPAFLAYMPAAVAYQLRPGADVLVLEPRGGLDVLIALAGGAHRITAAEPNPLIIAAASHVYRQPRVDVVVETARSFLSRSRQPYDLVVYSLTSTYHPVNSGAYSLAEDYRYTLESFRQALALLDEDGMLVVTRWLQTPPSEWLRAYTLAVTSLEEEGIDPAQSIAAFRTYNTGALLVKRSAFTPAELEVVRRFTRERAFDMVYAPDISPDEVNQFNILPQPVYYEAFTSFLVADSRQAWYAAYPYDVDPPVDDHPFFGHYFKWSQASLVFAGLGKTWQPFGGAGYFVLLLMLALALLMAAGLILLPVAVAQRRAVQPSASGMQFSKHRARAALAYFGLIGLGFLLVEIPLMQSFILYLGQPSYAMTAVLFTLLLFSGLGSRLSPHLPHRPALFLLVLILAGLPWLLPRCFDLTLGFSFALRLGVSVLVLALPGFLMGILFPRGMTYLADAPPGWLPWVWGVNGAASVVSSALAALLALSFGFRLVLWVGTVCYAVAWFIVPALPVESTPLRSPLR